MTKDEALDLALEALESERPYLGPMPSKTVKAITAIKQARALDKMADNARELGLDYEPVLVQQPATLDEMHDIGNGIMYGEPAPVQEPFGWWFTPNGEFLLPTEVEVDNPRDYETYRAMYIDTPPAQPAPVAFEVGLVEWVGNKLMATPKTTTAPPASWVEMVTANLVREGVNKHRARELAEHFYGLAQPAPVQEPVAFLANGTRFKISYDSRQSGGQIHGIPPELGGRWVAFIAAEDDCHLKLTTPPAAQRPFVGLTDEEIIKAVPGGIYDCLNDPWDCGVGDGDTLRSIKKDVLRIARAIEVKLKEKNT